MGNSPTPPGLIERIMRMVDERITRFARSGFLRNASITKGGITVRGAGGITIDGGALRVRGLPNAQPGATGDSTVYMGGITPLLPDGTTQPGLIVRRNDGTIVLALGDPTPDPSTPGGFQQFLSWYDRAQNIVMSDDDSSGQGLSRPYVPIPVTRARYTDMVAVTDGTFVDVFDSLPFYKVNARALVNLRYTTDVSGTAGEIRVLVDGVQVGSTVAVGFAVSTNFIGPFVVPGDAYTAHTIKVQARRTAGTGAVRLDAAILGMQS